MIAIATMVAAVAAPAVAQNTADKDAMIAAIAAAGCRVDGSNNSAILASAKLSEDAAAVVVQSLLDSGQAKLDGGVLVLTTGGCS
jgi:hypothetical protein